MKKYLSDLSFFDIIATKFNPEDWFSNLPVLKSERLILRKMRMSDANDVFAWSSDDRVARYVLWDTHRTVSDSKNYIRYLRHLYRSGLPSSWALELKETGHVIGTIGLMWYSAANNSAEIGYSLSAEYWNRGLMTEAVHTVLDFCFETLKLNRVEAQYDVRNAASGRVMEKCGLRQEGILRNRIYNKSEYVDVSLCAVLRSDRISGS